VPVALDEHARAGGLEDGDALLMLALGGGMGWGSALYRWAGPETLARARARTA
jgi:3-oxoacyl-[acyl-carrier-protein] synthase III